MISGKRVLGIITARGSSKGIPRKNLVPLAGKPLIAWTIESARESGIDRLVLSSEDAEIMAVARMLGCEVPFERPAELAMDDTPGMAPVVHAVRQVAEGFDYVVLLQPTSPLRTAGDIDACVHMCIESGAPACVSVTRVVHGPHWMFTIDGSGVLQPFMSGDVIERRQDLPVAYALNGAVYVARIEHILAAGTFLTPDTVAYVMPRARSFDIDEPLDLLIAAAIIGGNAP